MIFSISSQENKLQPPTKKKHHFLSLSAYPNPFDFLPICRISCVGEGAEAEAVEVERGEECLLTGSNVIFGICSEVVAVVVAGVAGVVDVAAVDAAASTDDAAATAAPALVAAPTRERVSRRPIAVVTRRERFIVFVVAVEFF